jgi:hypothetical protein
MDLELVPENVRLMVNGRRLLDVVMLAMDLDLFRMLGHNPTAAEMAASLGTDAQFVEYLLGVLCRFGYAEAVPAAGGADAYRPTPVSAQYLDSRSPLYLGKDLLANCETGSLVSGYGKHGPVTPVIDRGHWSESRMRSIAGVALLGGLQSTLAAADLSGRRRLLDIGGGHGLYSVFFTRKYPGLQATIVELPEVAAIARDYVSRCGAEESVEVIASDYREFRPDRPYDVIFLSNVAPSLDELGHLLAFSCTCLEPGGIVVLRNFVSDAPADPWSTVTLLERYCRRGLKGLTTAELARAMEAGGLSGIVTLAYQDCTVLLEGSRK